MILIIIAGHYLIFAMLFMQLRGSLDLMITNHGTFTKIRIPFT